MAAPTPVAETYLNCVNSSFTVGTTPDTWVGGITEGGLTCTVETDEMTNTGSGGGYEDVTTVTKYEGTMTLAYKAGSPPPYEPGQMFPVTIKGPVGAVQLVGNWRFNEVEDPILTVKGGYKQKFKLTSQGAIARSVSA